MGASVTVQERKEHDMSDETNDQQRWLHMAMAVAVDRFDDKYLAKRVCPTFTLPSGKHPTPAHLRILCAQARAKGLEVFPPCDNVDERGRCLGHPERDTGEPKPEPAGPSAHFPGGAR